MRRQRQLMALALAALVAALPGCGGSGGVKVRGKLLKGGAVYVIPDGQRVTVTFVSLGGQDASGKSSTGADPFLATFEPGGLDFVVNGREGNGIAPGKYRVAVTLRWTAEYFAANKPRQIPGQESIDRETDLLGDRFGPLTSPIVRDVDGSAEVVVDLDKPTGA